MTPAKPAYDGTPISSDDYNSLVHLRRFGVQPPSALYVARDDVIQLRTFVTFLPATVNVTLRILGPDGQVIPTFRSVAVPAASNPAPITVITGVEGWVLSATIETPGTLQGIAYVMLEVSRGAGSGDQTAGQLFLAGYPGSNKKLSYPATPIRGSLDGPGLRNIRQIVTPAAGADFTFSVPGGTQLLPRSIRAILTTAVAVANRIPHLKIDDGAGDIMMDIPAVANQAASLVQSYSWITAGIAYGFDNANVLPLPNTPWLQPGWRIFSTTTAIQAADQWSVVWMLDEEVVSA